LVPQYLSEVTVQSYFAYVVYTLSDRRLAPIVPIMLLALLGIASGLGVTIVMATYGIAHGGIALTALPVTKTLFNLQLPATFACDLLITISLFITLRGKKPNIASGIDDMYPALAQTNTMLQKLMVNAVNRGFLTTITAALTLILFLALPGTFYFYLGALPSSKLYMNSLLAMLNSRQYVAESSRNTAGSNSIRLPTSHGADFELSTMNRKGLGADALVL